MPSNPTIFGYTLQDDSGAKANAAFYAEFDGAVLTVDGLTGAWTAMGGKLDAITDAKIVSGSVKIPLGRDASWKASPVTDARLVNSGVFNFTNDTTFKKDGFAIPAIANAVVTAGKIVLTNTAVAAFITELIGGFASGNFSNGASQGLVALADAFLTARRHPSVKQRSFEVA